MGPFAPPQSGPSSPQRLAGSWQSSQRQDIERRQESERYASVGVVPPLKADNCSRFKSFIDRINRRQWEFLGDTVQGKLSYNNNVLSLYEFTLLLKQEFAPRTNVTMDIVTALGGCQDPERQGPVAARLRVKTLLKEGSSTASSPRGLLEYARHMFVHFTDNKISQVYDISDESDKQSQGQSIAPPPPLRPPAPRTSIDIRQFYAEYIACINSGRMAEDLHQFCKPSGVVWNGTEMSIQQYGDMIQNSLDAISGLYFDVRTLVIDESRQQIAARIEFTGTPVKPFAGGVPNGRSVAFAEHVFYWLEQGKISDVLSIVDWDEYRSQLAR
ncbi:hypothetical protein VTI74DRAFT_372 [Chaetomium olivicolor]